MKKSPFHDKPVLYLMLGYPGAGKTTTSRLIHELTGAVHLWADHIRREIYKKPTYTHKENLQLYTHLNRLTGELLAAKNSVIFDTNFSYRKDRRHLSEIAKKHGAITKLIWIAVPEEVARKRATADAHLQKTRVLGNMSHKDFDRIISHIEEPGSKESFIKVDGTKITETYIKSLLKL